MHFSTGLLTALSAASLGAANPVSERGVAQFQPKPGVFPATGDDTIAGGIFCISLPDLSTYLSKTGNNPGATGVDSPRAGAATTGSGPYPAGSLVDSTLPKHTIFAPKSPPAGNLSMPFIAWGNGGCGTDPSTYRNLLTEIASHGYVIAADGLAGGNIGASQTMVTDMRASVDWVSKGGAAKYGNVNTSAIITMGHSCGGLEAMSTAYHDARIGHMFLFDIAIFNDEKRYLLQELKVPVAWMVGGPKDMGYPNAKKDYALLPAGLPAAFASLDTGHGGTFAATNGGKAAIAAVNYLEWQMRGNASAKAMWLEPKGANGLTTQGFPEVMTKNW